MEWGLEVLDAQVGYHQAPVVDGLSLRVRERSLVCLLGPSGCGKTTVLRAIAGFNKLSRGEIRIRGRAVAADKLHMPPERRSTGLVFQGNTLFPHLTALENVGFGLRNRRSRQARAEAHALLALMRIEDLARRYPHELSGGQQQRVAIARALAPKPSLVLLDEPFSSLDVELREELSAEVAGVLRDNGLTAVMVTHDQREAFALGEEIGVMHGGVILQWDTPEVLYQRPRHRFVGDFIGDGVFVPGRVCEGGGIQTELGVLAASVTGPSASIGPGAEVEVLVRPHDVRLLDSGTGVRVRVAHRVFRGSEVLYTLSLPSGRELLVAVAHGRVLDLGSPVSVAVNTSELAGFPCGAGGRASIGSASARRCAVKGNADGAE